MQKIVILLLFFVVMTAQVSAKVPDWVKDFDSSAKFPAKLYLVGFGVAEGNLREAEGLAEENAISEVSRMIVVSVKSLISSVAEEKDQQYSQYLSSITQSSSSIRGLMGLQVEKYIDRDSKVPIIYAVACVSRSDLRQIYSKRKKELIDQINEIIASAQADESNSRFIEAVTKYSSLYPLYEELKEAEAILLVAGESKTANTAFDELDKDNSMTLMSQTEVSNKVDLLLSSPMGSISDVARAVVFRLSKQINRIDGRVLVVPFTYQDTKMSSSFARYFRAELENQLAQMANWRTANMPQSFIPRSSYITRDLAMESNAEYLLWGTYWEQGDKIRLIVNMRDVTSGRVLAGTDVTFDANVVPADVDLKPQNYESALIAQSAFAEGEIVSSQLRVDVWTNKGNESLLYTEGETMKVYVRVNRESHIRLLYILADGRWTVLYDDLYIDQSKVNSVVEVPMEFECAAPFGAEMLVVVARTKEFEPLPTIEEDGYFFINKKPGMTTRSLVADVRGTKGMKPKKQETISIIDQKYSNDLDNNKITSAFMQELGNNNLPISQNATISIETPGKEWLITDTDNMQTYLVRKEEDKLDIYKIQQAEARVVVTTIPKSDQ